MEKLYSGNPQRVFDRARAIEEKLKLKRKNAKKLGLSYNEIRFIEVSLDYIKEYLQWFSKTLLTG